MSIWNFFWPHPPPSPPPTFLLPHPSSSSHTPPPDTQQGIPFVYICMIVISSRVFLAPHPPGVFACARVCVCVCVSLRLYVWGGEKLGRKETLPHPPHLVRTLLIGRIDLGGKRGGREVNRSSRIYLESLRVKGESSALAVWIYQDANFETSLGRVSHSALHIFTPKQSPQLRCAPLFLSKKKKHGRAGS